MKIEEFKLALERCIEANTSNNPLLGDFIVLYRDLLVNDLCSLLCRFTREDFTDVMEKFKQARWGRGK